MIFIKAYFGDWNKATIEQAVRLYKSLSEISRRKYFEKHFKGVNRERLEAERKRNS